MIRKDIITSLIHAVTCLFQEMQDLFSDNNEKREEAIKEYKDHTLELIKALEYILAQAEKYHQFKLSKGGEDNGNRSVIPMGTEKRAS